MSGPAGYLINGPGGLSGERGIGYNYILAGNGLFIEADNRFIAARIPVVDCPVRGLAPLERYLRLIYGSIPQRFWDLTLNAFMANPTVEEYAAIKAGQGYEFFLPRQDQHQGKVTYEVPENVVLELHSHNSMTAGFSPIDNNDEQGLKIFGVVGCLDKTPIVHLRLGVYGYFEVLSWKDVFDGELNGAAEFEQEEVSEENDVHHQARPHGLQMEYLSDWDRRDWWIRR